MDKHPIKISRTVLAAVLILALSSILSAATKVKVAVEIANVRSRPDIGSSIIRQIPQGTILESVGKEGEWYLVSLEDPGEGPTSGYVHESLVLEVEPIPRIEKKAPPVQTQKVVTKPETVPETQIPQPKSKPLVVETKKERRFALTLGGGGNYIRVEDLNQGAAGLADYYSDSLGIKNEGEISPVHLSFILGGEFLIPLSSQFMIGLGTDFFQGSRESSVSYKKGTSEYSLRTYPKVQAIPVSFSVLYYPFSFLYVKFGTAYYFARCQYFYRYEKEGFWQEWEGDASARGLGLQGGFGIELSLSSPVAWVIEVSGKYAKVKKFKGEGTYNDPSLTEAAVEEGTLYFYSGKAGANSYPLLFIRNKVPSEAGVMNPREAMIDFSGLSLTTGFRVRF